ncbi:MAG: hypothetical protein J7513_10495 [Solirubrobacteraceae bacterium]|nr:hypothetical protein [Solirubrobacteraceae bacterium]
MSDPYIAFAWVVGIVNAVAAVAGLAQWALNRPGPPFWLLVRGGQVIAAAYAVFAGIYAAVADPPADGLAWVYILTPVAVTYFAEQLRIIAAQTVLERHGYADAGELRSAVSSGDDDADRLATGIANEVLLREVAILALGAAVISFLAWRAVLTG